MKRLATLLSLAIAVLLAGCFGIWERESDSSPWVPPWQRAVASPRPWKWIVLHHSGSPIGGARELSPPPPEDEDEDAPPDCPYHFVIGNGRGSGAGEVEISRRWLEQRVTDHVTAPGVAEDAIGICLIGNFDEGDPTLAQETALLRLCLHLTGAFHIDDAAILAHCEVQQPGQPPTTCPGSRFDMIPFRKMLEGTRQSAPRDFRVPENEQPAAAPR